MPIDWSCATVLSLAECDVAREMLGLHRFTAVLGLPSPGATEQERERIVRNATASLRDRGLVTGVRPSPELEQDMRLLVCAETHRDLVVTAPSRYSAVAATSGTQTVLAVRRGERVAFVGLPPQRATVELVGLLGPVVPGPGRPVRVPAAVLGDAVRAGGGDRDRFTAELMRRGLDGPGALALQRTSDVTGVGQLGASRRSRGRRRRAPVMLLVQATADGCYRQRRVPAPGGETVVEVAAAGSRSLARELDELVTALERPGPAPTAHRSLV